MDLPYNRPATPRVYLSSVRPPINIVNYEDDDVMSSSSCNFPHSCGSTTNFEQPTHMENVTTATGGTCSNGGGGGGGGGGCGGGGGVGNGSRVREMIKMYDSVAKSSSTSVASTPVRRTNSVLFSSPPSAKPYYNVAGSGNCGGTAGGGGVNQFGGSQHSVKQFVTQFQEADEQVKSTERCRRCNVLKRCDKVHYCISSKQQQQPQQHGSVDYNRLMGRTDGGEYNNVSGNMKPQNSLKLINSSGNLSLFSKANNYISSTPNQDHLAKNVCAARLNASELYDEVDCIPVEAAYDSKTTIIKTGDGVRIVVDIMFNQMQNLSAADVVGSRVETDIPRSRILTEFQQQQNALTMGTAHGGNN